MVNDKRPIQVPWGQHRHDGSIEDGLRTINPGEPGYEEALASARWHATNFDMPIRYGTDALQSVMKAAEPEKPEPKPGNWMTIVQGGMPMHAFVHSSGKIQDGPGPLIGLDIQAIKSVPGKRIVTYYKRGYTPVGAKDHPSHGQWSGEAAKDPEKAIEQALNQLKSHEAVQYPKGAKDLPPGEDQADTEDGPSLGEDAVMHLDSDRRNSDWPKSDWDLHGAITEQLPAMLGFPPDEGHEDALSKFLELPIADAMPAHIELALRRRGSKMPQRENPLAKSAQPETPLGPGHWVSLHGEDGIVHIYVAAAGNEHGPGTIVMGPGHLVGQQLDHVLSLPGIQHVQHHVEGADPPEKQSTGVLTKAISDDDLWAQWLNNSDEDQPQATANPMPSPGADEWQPSEPEPMVPQVNANPEAGIINDAYTKYDQQQAGGNDLTPPAQDKKPWPKMPRIVPSQGKPPLASDTFTPDIAKGTADFATRLQRYTNGSPISRIDAKDAIVRHMADTMRTDGITDDAIGMAHNAMKGKILDPMGADDDDQGFETEFKTPEKDAHEKFVGDLLRSWATSATNHPVSLATQMITHDMWPSHTSEVSGHDASPAVQEAAQKLYTEKRFHGSVRSVLRGMAAATAARFKKAGVQNVLVSRPMLDSDHPKLVGAVKKGLAEHMGEPGHWHQVVSLQRKDMNALPLSSWSLHHEDQAKSLPANIGNTGSAHGLLIATVPASQIISTGRTGFGSLRKGEVVLKNAPTKATAVVGGTGQHVAAQVGKMKILGHPSK